MARYRQIYIEFWQDGLGRAGDRVVRRDAQRQLVHDGLAREQARRGADPPDGLGVGAWRVSLQRTGACRGGGIDGVDVVLHRERDTGERPVTGDIVGGSPQHGTGHPVGERVEPGAVVGARRQCRQVLRTGHCPRPKPLPRLAHRPPARLDLTHRTHPTGYRTGLGTSR